MIEYGTKVKAWDTGCESDKSEGFYIGKLTTKGAEHHLVVWYHSDKVKAVPELNPDYMLFGSNNLPKGGANLCPFENVEEIAEPTTTPIERLAIELGVDVEDARIAVSKYLQEVTE